MTPTERSNIENKRDFIRIRETSELEIDFILDYLRDFSHDFKYRRKFEKEDEKTLYDLFIESNATNLAEFAIYHLEKAYQIDENRYVSDICGMLRGNCPIDIRIENILEKGIKDISKSNRLRERFFWVYDYGFKESSKRFFRNNLERFIKDNFENPELIGQIVDSIHWNFNNENVDEISRIVKKYADKKPEVLSKIHSLSKKLLNING